MPKLRVSQKLAKELGWLHSVNAETQKPFLNKEQNPNHASQGKQIVSTHTKIQKAVTGNLSFP